MDGRARAGPLLLPADAVPRRPPAEPAVAVGGLAVHDRAGGGTVAVAFRPGAFPPGLSDLGPIENPLGLPALASLLAVVNAAARLIVMVLYLAAAGSLLVRLRRSRGVERQQLNWVAYAGVLLIGSFLLVSLLEGREIAAPVQLAVDISFFVLGVSGSPPPSPWPSCAPGCTPSTGSSTRPWSTGSSPRCSGSGTAGWCWSWDSCPAAWPATHRTGRSPRRPWRWRRCSSRPAAASGGVSTGASTAALRRRPDDRGVQRPPPRGGRPGNPLGRAPGRGRRDHGPGGRVTLAPPGRPGALAHLAPRGRDGPYPASRAWRCWIQRRRPAAFDW
jgi:hypothetical protein